MSTPGTAITRPSRTIIQTTVLRAAPIARHLREGSLGATVGLERFGVEVARHIRPRVNGRQGHELLGTGNRECSQNECVEQAAYCRGRANSQRQRDNDDQGESRSPSQTAEGMPNVKT
jgi:hypothetical protein